MGDDIRVGELFAGVGGFRLGLEGRPGADQNTGFKVVFSNQWEPGEKAQWASQIYEQRFGPEGHTRNSIHDFTHPKDGVADILDHDLLVGGFPCQDYSVARTVSGELGIKGEKGKLWVDIARIIRHKRPRPKVVLLENVPRLLNSPANARGLNFAIILKDLISMGYEVEWRVINATDYGMPQQRDRVFILAYRTPGSTSHISSINGKGRFGSLRKTHGPISRWILGGREDMSEKWEIGPFFDAFPCTGEFPGMADLLPNIEEFAHRKSSPFGNAGYAWKYRYGGKSPKKQEIRFWSTRVKAEYNGEKQNLDDVLDEKFDKKYEIDPGRLDEWRYAKSAKNEFRLQKKHRDNVDRDLYERYVECMSAPFGERRAMWMDEEWRARFKAAVGAGRSPLRRGDDGLRHPRQSFQDNGHRRDWEYSVPHASHL